jgi:hypothetical protein
VRGEWSVIITGSIHKAKVFCRIEEHTCIVLQNKLMKVFLKTQNSEQMQQLSVKHKTKQKKKIRNM